MLFIRLVCLVSVSHNCLPIIYSFTTRECTHINIINVPHINKQTSIHKRTRISSSCNSRSGSFTKLQFGQWTGMSWTNNRNLFGCGVHWSRCRGSTTTSISTTRSRSDHYFGRHRLRLQWTYIIYIYIYIYMEWSTVLLDYLCATNIGTRYQWYRRDLWYRYRTVSFYVCMWSGKTSNPFCRTGSNYQPRQNMYSSRSGNKKDVFFDSGTLVHRIQFLHRNNIKVCRLDIATRRFHFT